MFEYPQLNDIASDYVNLRTTITNTINNNVFVRNGFKKNIYNLSDDTILKAMHYVLETDAINYICVGVNNIIEWTPIKLFQSVYFMIKVDNKFWIVERNAYKSTVVLTITLKDYLKSLYEIGEKSNYMNAKYCPSQNDFKNALSNLNNDATFIKQDKYINNKINHYLYKYNGHIYYISTVYLNGSVNVFKPAIFGKADSIFHNPNISIKSDLADLHI
jgi:hypothetical protein